MDTIIQRIRKIRIDHIRGGGLNPTRLYLGLTETEDLARWAQAELHYTSSFDPAGGVCKIEGMEVFCVTTTSHMFCT